MFAGFSKYCRLCNTFQYTNYLTRQLESLLVADTGQNHASASSKPKVYKIRQPFLKVEDVSRKYRPIIYTPRVWPLPSIQTSTSSPFDEHRSNYHQMTSTARPIRGYCENCKVKYIQLWMITLQVKNTRILQMMIPILRRLMLLYHLELNLLTF